MSKPPKENLIIRKNLFQIEKFYQKIIPEYFDDGTFWDLLSGNSTSQNSNVIFQLYVS